MDPNRDMMNELYRLTKENNAMLHSMRRHALIGGVIKYTIWILLFVVAPLWIYSTYLAPTVAQITSTMDQMQTAGVQAKAQMSSLEEMWNKMRSLLPGSSTNTTPQTN